ncbi:hypothetical protein FKM82_005411 [Ascaphus truei]
MTDISIQASTAITLQIRQPCQDTRETNKREHEVHSWIQTIVTRPRDSNHLAGLLSPRRVIPGPIASLTAHTATPGGPSVKAFYRRAE